MSWVNIQKKNKHNNDYKHITQLEINFFLMRTECETRCWLFGKTADKHVCVGCVLKILHSE